MIGKPSKFEMLLMNDRELKEVIIGDFARILIEEVELLIKENGKEEMMKLIES